MKRLLVLFVSFLTVISACEKVTPEEPIETDPPKTTYTLVDNVGTYDELVRMCEKNGFVVDGTGKYGCTIDYEVSMIEYSSTKWTHTNTMLKPRKGKKYPFEPFPDAEYLTVCIKWSITNNGKVISSKKNYIAHIFNLKKGEDTLISIEENTPVSDHEPTK